MDSNIVDFLVQKLREFFYAQSKAKAVIGVSGGLDSSVVAVLAAKALGNQNVEFYFLPSANTSKLTRDCLYQLSKIFYITIREEPNVVNNISEVILTLLGRIFIEKNQILETTEENIQSRARMLWLMSISNQTGGLLLNCMNRSEYLTGYYTLYGDTAGAIAPIAHLYKTEVYRLGKSLLLPEVILKRPPTAELRFGQLDSDSLPTYEVLDGILRKIDSLEGHDETLEVEDVKTLEVVLNLIKHNSFKKKQFPPKLI